MSASFAQESLKVTCSEKLNIGKTPLVGWDAFLIVLNSIIYILGGDIFQDKLFTRIIINRHDPGSSGDAEWAKFLEFDFSRLY